MMDLFWNLNLLGELDVLPVKLQDLYRIVCARLKPDPKDDGPLLESKPFGRARCLTCKIARPLSNCMFQVKPDPKDDGPLLESKPFGRAKCLTCKMATFIELNG